MWPIRDLFLLFRKHFLIWEIEKCNSGKEFLIVHLAQIWNTFFPSWSFPTWARKPMSLKIELSAPFSYARPLHDLGQLLFSYLAERCVIMWTVTWRIVCLAFFFFLWFFSNYAGVKQHTEVFRTSRVILLFHTNFLVNTNNMQTDKPVKSPALFIEVIVWFSNSSEAVN